ncbi:MULTISPECIES: YeeE/YedE family protein [Hyphomicrobiales]|jgi:uncharacterized membrane protein YedE/YeeE|uniref:YeeE/YedE family protein n=1 Tax=Bosea massiliensis TaxID=151419 RepID=A0ABW0P4W1_9HYPH|nr:YeeE/YedE family protein [Methylobacterium sp. CCH7-A2]
MSAYWPSLFGGMVLGLSAGMLLLLNGRIAGISGIVGRLLGGLQAWVNGAFVAGLLAGPAIYATIHGALPAMTVSASWPVIIVAGLLVGIGTRMGSGCTSGHGILGLARLSKRSMVATLSFLGAGVATATLSGMLS